MDRIKELRRRFYSDERWDGTRSFYGWMRQHSKSDYTVLNVGAGRTSDKKVCSFRGEVKQVVGVDIDKVVLTNEDLDVAIVIKDNKLPFPEDCFDLAWADFVMEHVEDPEALLKEVKRVLKPGQSFFFRTPNSYHYVSLIGRATPHWFHRLVVNRVRGLPNGNDEPHETFYRFNTKMTITCLAEKLGFRTIELRHIECEPSYLVFHPAAFYIGVAYERYVNRFAALAELRANIFGRLVK